MTVTVNGKTTKLADDATVAQVLARYLGPSPATSGVAVALNGEVVVRAEWGSRRLQPQDRVEVLAARGGG
ncbi:MAG: sulfur carrier protein ThiS [Actinomycetota bacterium]|nr:sulfur carrier protein ThiS [Actinomycetota bacterium]